MSEARQRVIETNRSLRLIKNELESLLEKGVITDSAFDSIHALLPAESTLSGPAAAAARSNNPTPAQSTTGLPTPSSTSSPAPAPAPAPPSYAQSTASPPALPSRNNPPPPAAPAKPILTHARALYRYAAGDARDCSFERDDRLAVHEYMNADWWMGRNLRTGQEGIFPRSYVVVVEEHEKTMPVYGGYPQQPQYAATPVGGGGYPMAPVPVQGGYPAAPPAGQAAVPYQQQQQQQPQQQEGEGGGKMGEHGKKFGKKLGNAAIFGAGATIGSNIVNSIF
ncbi:SH3 domain-containing protein [Parachaetomium inaequale]|uniref:SH3 domain-containing protein n=1 Tax=Parachaetomium inaequale TaxID=2588326 RepID=A0AAN6SUU3_9PEZI|nr:SH3 domain-containing protein [Parachaetomium inaequale]